MVTPGPVAIVIYGDMIEDYLSPLGMTLADFAERVTGTWLFGLVDALASAGRPSMLVCFSRSFSGELRLVHASSGAAIVGLPTPWLHQRLSGLPPRAARTLGRASNVVVPYQETPVLRLSRLLAAAGCSAVICQEYEHPRFDVVVAAGRLAKVPVFATFQALEPSTSRVHHLGRRLAMRHCAGLLVADQREADRVRATYGIPAGKVNRVPNALDLARWEPVEQAVARHRLGIPPDDHVIAWHGRIQLRRKGLDLLVEACRRLGGMGLDRPLRLVIVGTGLDAPEFERLLDSVDDLAVTWKNKYVVDTGELATWLSAADVYAFPSRREGFAIAPLEAMACRVPVVAADVEGIRHALPEDEQSGGIVVPRDDPVALAKGLYRMLTDAELRKRVGEAGRRRVADAFSVEAVGRQLAAVLDRAPVRRG